MQNSTLLTTAQVADAKGVTPRTVARWVKAGRLAFAVKIPGDTGAYLFDPATVDAFDPDEPAVTAS